MTVSITTVAIIMKTTIRDSYVNKIPSTFSSTSKEGSVFLQQTQQSHVLLSTIAICYSSFHIFIFILTPSFLSIRFPLTCRTNGCKAGQTILHMFMPLLVSVHTSSRVIQLVRNVRHLRPGPRGGLPPFATEVKVDVGGRRAVSRRL